jgi:hypothetical protein
MFGKRAVELLREVVNVLPEHLPAYNVSVHHRPSLLPLYAPPACLCVAQSSGARGVRLHSIAPLEGSAGRDPVRHVQDEGVRLVLEEIEQHNSVMHATIRCVAPDPPGGVPLHFLPMCS